MDVIKEVKKARKGHKAAFEKLIFEHEKVMYRVAKSILKKDEDCADVIQEAIIKAFTNIQQLKEPHYFKTWLIRIVMNECYAVLRKRKKIIDIYELDSATEDSGYRSVELKLLFNQLPHNQAEILSLFYIKDLSIKEIAEILKIPENTAKTKIRRSRNYLRHLLTQKEGDSDWTSGRMK
ncbi:RNA polymerase sigma-70 factor, ECF subfamily [Salinibacillus kushneri]|uniref:RNA polymerase sigma-70 factor, ECF subfamily n=1 Tax=Salinibacillus kushneri TaxID=237682 RepID=A0A1I0DWG6_9BACI|nr:sigma-70 family RNA polymerase sigma factor [Salinibacillus kushneri]SET36872.1 RNA polymerase sigma-70 factor, ECF subfamily [Salinibacillus kushneri]